MGRSWPVVVTKRVGKKLELTWAGGGTLETRASLSTGAWTAVSGAASGIQIDPAGGAAGFYRVRP